jgi:8-oxo-dGTP pyrophosphatase MutT (NUDIX family)
MLRQTTLCLLIKNNQILLTMKKRGFGIGKWNGCGGKLKEDETLEEAALREMSEEIGAFSKKEDISSVGKLEFYFKHNPEWNQAVNIFLVHDWQGEHSESEEVKPAWFSFDDIPYSNMWPDDKYWLPKVLNGKQIEGKFYFNDDASEFERFELREI